MGIIFSMIAVSQDKTEIDDLESQRELNELLLVEQFLFEPRPCRLTARPVLVSDLPDEENQLDPTDEWRRIEPRERMNRWLNKVFAPYTNTPMPTDVFDRMRIRFINYHYYLFTVDNGDEMFVQRYANIKYPAIKFIRTVDDNECLVREKHRDARFVHNT
jgi:hypothetical protein